MRLDIPRVAAYLQHDRQPRTISCMLCIYPGLASLSSCRMIARLRRSLLLLDFHGNDYWGGGGIKRLSRRLKKGGRPTSLQR